MTARPLLGTQQPQCATDAEVIVADLTWLHPDGREERVQNGNLAPFPAGQTLMRGLFEFARQFELMFSVKSTSSQLYLSQSPVRRQERIRKNALLNSVWVDNPGDRQELLLIDPKTGKPRLQSGSQIPLRVGCPWVPLLGSFPVPVECLGVVFLDAIAI